MPVVNATFGLIGQFGWIGNVPDAEGTASAEATCLSRLFGTVYKFSTLREAKHSKASSNLVVRDR
jgi:hypothetical protein